MTSLAAARRLTLFLAAASSACASSPEPRVAPRVAVAPTPPDEIVGPQFGGPGGSPAQVRCPLSFGIQGQSGTLIDRVGLVCFLAENAWESPAFGGGGGTRFQRICPLGARATGIFGRSGDLVDQIGLLCRDSSAQVASTEPAGGGGGNAFSWECPTGYALIGLDVMAGQYVDAVAAVCGRL